MGKHRHSKDRLFFKTTELAQMRNDEVVPKYFDSIKKPSFNICALTLQPWTNPVCTLAGDIFDLVSISEAIANTGKNPLTDQPLTFNQLIKLKFHKGPKDILVCPLSGKEFTENTKICTVRTSGNVFAFDVIEKLNLKPKIYEDLVSGEPFMPEDIVVLQEPNKFIAQKRPQPKAENNFLTKRINLSLANENLLRNIEAEVNLPNFSFYKKVKGETRSVLSEEDLRKEVTLEQFFEEREKLQDWKILDEKQSGFVGEMAKNGWQAPARSYTRFEMFSKVLERVRSETLESNIELDSSVGKISIKLFSNHCPRCVFSFISFVKETKNFFKLSNKKDSLLLSWEDNSEKSFTSMDKCPNLKHDEAGLLTINNLGKIKTLGLTLAPLPQLNADYCVFGKIAKNSPVLSVLSARALRNEILEIKVYQIVIIADAITKTINTIRKEIYESSKSQQNAKEG